MVRSNDRLTIKDYLESIEKHFDSTVVSIEKIFRIELQAAEERLTNNIGDAISNHQKNCDAARLLNETTRRGQLIINKKQIVTYVAGIAAIISTIIGLAIQLLNKL